MQTLLKDKAIIGVVGATLLIAGTVAVFVGRSDIGSATLVVVGGVLFGLAVLVDRIHLIKYGPYELHMARGFLEAADAAEDEGAESTADSLRETGLEILRQSEAGQVSTASAIRKLYEIARRQGEEAVTKALTTEGLEVERGWSTLVSGFSLVGVKDGRRVGIIIGAGGWKVERWVSDIVRGLHGTPGLIGVVVVEQVLARRRRGQVFPQASLLDLQRSVQVNLPESVSVRIVTWRQGESVDGISTAIREVMAN